MGKKTPSVTLIFSVHIIIILKFILNTKIMSHKPLLLSIFSTQFENIKRRHAISITKYVTVHYALRLFLLPE